MNTPKFETQLNSKKMNLLSKLPKEVVDYAVGLQDWIGKSTIYDNFLGSSIHTISEDLKINTNEALQLSASADLILLYIYTNRLKITRQLPPFVSTASSTKNGPELINLSTSLLPIAENQIYQLKENLSAEEILTVTLDLNNFLQEIIIYPEIIKNQKFTSVENLEREYKEIIGRGIGGLYKKLMGIPFMLNKNYSNGDFSTDYLLDLFLGFQIAQDTFLAKDFLNNKRADIPHPVFWMTLLPWNYCLISSLDEKVNEMWKSEFSWVDITRLAIKPNHIADAQNYAYNLLLNGLSKVPDNLESFRNMIVTLISSVEKH